MTVAELKPTVDMIPRLPRGVRLRYDETREHWILLAPERILKLDNVALAILKRCDGSTPIGAIIDDLAKDFDAERIEIETDVLDFLKELAEKRMLEL